MTAKILGTEKDPFSVNALENYAKKYIFHPYISFNIRFYSIQCHIQVLFGARKFFSVLFGGKSPFLSLVGPVFWPSETRSRSVMCTNPRLIVLFVYTTLFIFIR